jgi:hypothetical protein
MDSTKSPLAGKKRTLELLHVRHITIMECGSSIAVPFGQFGLIAKTTLNETKCHFEFRDAANFSPSSFVTSTRNTFALCTGLKTNVRNIYHEPESYLLLCCES